MKKHRIELDEKQMRLVAAALDLYTRVSIGQLDTIAEVPTLRQFMDKQFDKRESYKNYYDNPLVMALKVAKIEVTGSANGNMGIFHPDVTEDARIACHIGDAIKHHLYNCDDNPDKPKFGGNAFPPSIVKGLEIPIENVENKNV